MKKTILSIIIAIVMVVGLVPSFAIAANAADVASGSAGDISWKLTDDGTLTFSGTGAIPGYTLTARPDWYAFEAQIKKVVIESGITKVGNNAFNGCSVLSEVILPDTLTQIRNNVFYDCTNLSYVEYWGTTAPTLGMGVFNGCDNLLVVNVPTNYEGDAFTRGLNISKTLVASAATMTGTTGDCTWTFDDTTGTLTISGNGAIGNDQSWSEYMSSITSIVIEDGITSIANYAFCDCSSLESVTLSESVTTIGNYAFTGCSSLKSVTLPASVTKIGNAAFYACSSLDTVNYFGTSAPSVGSYAFMGSGLMVVNVPVDYEGDTFGDRDVVKTLAASAAEATCTNCGTGYENGFCTSCDGYEPAELVNGVYQIGNAGQLYWFADKVNNDYASFGTAKAILTADIVVNKNVLVNGALASNTTGFRTWTPIGYWWRAFTGTFDGAGHTISGLYLDSALYCVGLFGCVEEGGKIQNVGVIDSYFSGNGYAGGVVGDNSGTVTNCYNTGLVSGTEDYVGGVVGENSGTVTGCYNTRTVSGNKKIGGVVGNNTGTVESSYNTGKVSGTGEAIGGVVGYNHSIVKNNYNTGTVSGDCSVGGVIGLAYYNSKVNNNYNTGLVSGDRRVGGVVGENYKDSFINNCYFNSDIFSGKVVGSDSGHAINVAGMSNDQFKSGQVAYLLGSAFGQKLGAGGDSAPVFVTEDNKVYERSDNNGYTNHVHAWTYTANGTTITAICEEDGCYLTDGKGGSVTLSAPGDVIYNGTSFDAALTYDAWLFGDVQINYNAVERVNVTDEEIVAIISLGDKAVSVAYTIEKATITFDDFTMTNTGATYGDSGAGVTVTAKDHIVGIGEITVKYYDANGDLVTPVNAGAYTVKIDVAEGANYNAATDVELGAFTISPKSLSEGDVSLSFETTIYNGSEQKPEITIAGLMKDIDFTVSYSACVNAGTVTVTVNGNGNYEGAVEKYFTIKKATPSVSLTSPIDKVMPGYAIELNPTSDATEVNTFEIMDSEGYSVNGNVITIDDGVVVGTTITVKYRSVETANYNSVQSEITLTVGIPTFDTTDLEDAINMLEESLENSVAKLDELIKTGGTIEQINKEIQNINNSLVALNATNRLSAVENALDTLKNITVPGLEGLIKNNADAINVNQNDITKLQNTVATIQETLTKLNNEDIRLESLISNLDINLDSLYSSLSALSDRVSLTEKNISEIKADLANKYAELSALINAGALDINAINFTLESISNTLEILATQSDVEAEVGILTALIKDLTDRMDLNDSDIIANANAISDLSNTLRSLSVSVAAQDTALSHSIAGLSESLTALELRIAQAEKDISKIDASLKQAINDLNKAIADGDTALEEKITALGNALDSAKSALEKADADKKTELVKKIEDADKTLDEAIKAVQKNLDDAKAELNKAIADGDTALDESITALNNALDSAKSALEKADADNKAELVKKIEDADKTLDEAIKAVQKNLDDAKAELNKAIADGDTVLDEKITALNNALESAKKALEKVDTDNRAELVKKIDEADASLKMAIDALSEELDATNKKLDQLEIFIIIVCIISGVSFCGCATLAVFYFLDKRTPKKVNEREEKNAKNNKNDETNK